MAQLALGVVGAAVGGYFFGPAGASIGWSLGAAIGGTFEPNKHVYGPRINDLHLAGSSYGSFIVRGWGTFRTGCNIIDQTDLLETEHTSGGGKGGGGGTESHSYTYSASVDASICEGPVGSIRKIWANGRLIFDTTQGSTVDGGSVPVTFYLGDEAQSADPTFEAERGAGEVPAYRGTAHAVFANWELGPFGNALPQLNFEVTNETRLPGITEVRYRNDLPMYWGGYQGGGYTGSRFSPRILSWPLVGTIEITQMGTRGGTVELDAQTLDVAVAHLSASAEAATDDFDNADAPQIRYLYCGTADWGDEIWMSVVQGGSYYVHDRSLYAGNDELSFPSISGSRPTWTDLDPGAGTDMRALGSVDLAYTWGVTVGECPVGVALSENGRMVFLTVISDPTSAGGSGLSEVGTGDVDKWYKIMNGAVVASGSITSGTATDFYGNFSHRLAYAKVASFENNYRWMWYVAGGDRLVRLCHIGDDGVFAEDAQMAAATHEIWSSEGEWYPMDGSPAYHQTAEQSRVGIPAVADDATPTEESPAVWGLVPGLAYISILASSTEGYAGVTYHCFAATLKRFRAIDETVTLAQIVGDLCIIAGLEAGSSEYQYDVSDLEGIVVKGFVLTQQMSARAAIEALMPVYFFDAVESDGAIRFVRRGGASVASIPDDDLAAHADSESIPPLLSCVRTQEQDLPSTMSLTFINPEADYQVGAQTSRRMIGGSIEVVTVQAPVVLAPSEAKQRVDALLYAAWFERETYAWTTTRAYVHLEPTDVVTVGGDAKVLRITRKTEGANGVVKWEGVPSFGPIFSQTGGGGDGGDGFPPQEPIEAQDTALALLDVPLVDPLMGASSPVYYAAMAGADRRSWLGASLQRSADGGTNYSEVYADRTPETIGTASTALGDFHGGNIFDETNGVTVVLGGGAGELESVTADLVYQGANRAMLGDEMLQYRTATLIAASTYVLSGLLRGRNGTEWAMGSHAIGEKFVLIPSDWGGIAAAFSDIGNSRTYKAVTFGNTVAATDAVPFTYQGVVLFPYAPVYPTQGVNGDGDWLLSWTRRTRYGGEWRDWVDVPLSEASEAYVVTIWSDNSYATALRTITATTASATYTAAQQTTDFGSPQSEVYWSVAQVGVLGPGYDTLGRGPIAEVDEDAVTAPINPPSFTYEWHADGDIADPTTNAEKNYMYLFAISPTYAMIYLGVTAASLSNTITTRTGGAITFDEKTQIIQTVRIGPPAYPWPGDIPDIYSVGASPRVPAGAVGQSTLRFSYPTAQNCVICLPYPDNDLGG